MLPSELNLAFIWPKLWTVVASSYLKRVHILILALITESGRRRIQRCT